MLIRSQDKKHLVNMDSVTEISEFKGDICASFPFSDNETNYISIGKYSTEEKAMKVLDMIMWEVPKVFIMPADIEVEV